MLVCGRVWLCARIMPRLLELPGNFYVCALCERAESGCLRPEQVHSTARCGSCGVIVL